MRQRQVDFVGDEVVVEQQVQIDRARRMLRAGSPLGRVLKGRLGLELRMIVLGGDRILTKLERLDGDIFGRRPVLDAADWGAMLLRALRA